MDSIVEFKKVAFQPGEDRLLENLSFQIFENEMIRVEGASGSGKSTLLRLISSLIPRTDGEITYKGQRLEDVDYQTYRKSISYVAQNPHLFGQTIRDNFELVYEAHDKEFDEQLILDYMAQFGLDHIDLDKSIHKISGGEKQRVGLIRHLIFPPSVLLLDEITSSLDEGNRNKVWENLLAYKEKHQTTIMWVSHIQDDAVLPDRLFKIQDRQLNIERDA